MRLPPNRVLRSSELQTDHTSRRVASGQITEPALISRGPLLSMVGRLLRHLISSLVELCIQPTTLIERVFGTLWYNG